MDAAKVFGRAFGDITPDLRAYLKAVTPGTYDPALTVKFARMQATLADDLRASLPDMDPFARERVVMTTLQAFRDALSTAGLVSQATSMSLAKQAIAKSALRVQAQADDEEHAAERKAATDALVTEGVVMWAWQARLDAHTCLFCIAQNGTTYPVGVPMSSHPNCRCVPVPATGRRMASGEVFLRRLSKADRRRVMGKSRAAMFESGDYSLNDLVDRDKKRAIPVREFFSRFKPYDVVIRGMARQSAEGGFSVQPITRGVPSDGYMVAGISEAHIIPFKKGDPPDVAAVAIARFIDANIDKFKDPAVYLGGWRERGKLYIEPSQRVADRAEAVALGGRRGELAIYDVVRGTSIYMAVKKLVRKHRG